MVKALFLDRDDTLNYDPGHLGDSENVILYPYVVDSIKIIREILGYKTIVISNQAGIARGLITHNQVKEVNNKINQFLIDAGTRIDDFFYCPYHPEFSPLEKCNCRKPSPLMIIKAQKKHNIDLSKSFLVGDRIQDIQAGKNSNVKTIFLKHSLKKMNESELLECENNCDYFAEDFRDVVKILMDKVS